MAFKRVLYDEKKAYPDEYLTFTSSIGVEQRLYIRTAAANVNDISIRLKEADKAFAHGSYAYGDGKIESRKLKLSFPIKGADQRDHVRRYNELLQLFSQRDYSLRLAREDREYRVAGLVDVKQKWLRGFKWIWSDIDITLMLTDPFIYALSDTTIKKVFTSAQESAAIHVYNDSSIDVPLILEFTPVEGETMDNVKLMHVESGEQLLLSDSLLSYPRKAKIDGTRGTVRRDNDNSINTFSGVFLHAWAGSNTFKYTGSPGELKISFRKRWFV